MRYKCGNNKSMRVTCSVLQCFGRLDIEPLEAAVFIDAYDMCSFERLEWFAAFFVSIDYVHVDAVAVKKEIF